MTPADLIAIHQKTNIKRLSAFCRAVCAGCTAGAGIAYLCGEDYHSIARTIVDALSIASGIVGPSRAVRIVSTMDAETTELSMYEHKQEFYSGEGIIAKGVDNTIANVGPNRRQGYA